MDQRLPVHRLVPSKQFAPTDAIAVEQEKVNEVARLLWLPNDLSPQERNAKLVKAFDLLASIKPGDGVEMMLAEQMVGTHAAAMECLRRAMVPNQTFDGRNSALTHAQRLMSLYAKQVAALDKHRGKGQQKVTVEHVHVAPGAQAIVGNVEAGARTAAAGAGPEGASDGGAPREPQGHAFACARRQSNPGAGSPAMIGSHPRDTQSMQEAPRCGARTRKGTPSEAPAIKGKARCRMHGGKGSGAPRGNQNAVTSGLYTREALDMRAHVNRILRDGRKALKDIIE